MTYFSQLIALTEKNPEILESNTFFETIEEVPEDDDETHLDDNNSDDDDPYVDEDGNFLANEQIVSDVDDDLTIDDKEYHEALDGYREVARPHEGSSCCSWILPCCCPIRSDKPTGRGEGESSGGKDVLSGKTGRGKGGRGSKGSGRSSETRGRSKKE